jgi:ATP-dependent Clp protease ATP-binding subunit ClpC
MRHSQIGTEHLLLGLMRDQGGIAGQVLHELGLEIETVLTLTEEITGYGDYQEKTLSLSPGTQRVLELAVEEARKLGHHYIGVEHILLGLVEHDQGVAVEVLGQLGVTAEQIRRQTLRIIEEQKEERAGGERKPASRRKQKKDKNKTPMVDQLATDLTELAEDGKLDPVIGRQTEIERVIQILARRTKNNPALIGEPGVGKTAIVEGLTQRIADGEVPAPLLGKRVLQLDLGSLVAGTMYRGQFEERMKRVISELKSSDAILFIDEVHMLVGAGSAGSAMDAANILKPALARGELQVVGATTLDEYRKHIESDAALERRFQPIMVEEPSEEETIEILRGIRSRYEAHHQLSISDEALEAATSLSSRYVSDRYLPDKAIDLIDEASSRVRMYKNPIGEDAKQVVSKLRDIRKEIKEFEDEERTVSDELEDREADLEEELEKIKIAWDRDTSPTVSHDDIAEVVSMWTGVPVMELRKEESARLLQMEEELKKHIVGQEEAIATISKAVRRARAGLKDPKRPVGSFVFLGPTGVGKTELTKALAKFLFGSEDALIQLDMSEFMERHSVSRLVGAPPGYIGYDDAGQLTEAIRRRPYSIVVFDEIEKAHPETHNMLLQIMEEGHITDARGRTVDFRNAIIVMTSNVGADVIKQKTSLGFELAQDEDAAEKQAYQEMSKKLLKSLRNSFRPEFINRIDSVIVFQALSKENIRDIVSLELDKVRTRLKEKNLALDITPEGVDLLAKLGFNPEMGARPLRRVIQQKIENQLSDMVLSGEFEAGDTVLIDADLEKTEDHEEGSIVLKKGESQYPENNPEFEEEPIAMG